jgi:translation initiation factor IF-2
MSYVEVSAKTGMNITAALLTMVSEIAEAAADTAVR